MKKRLMLLDIISTILILFAIASVADAGVKSFGFAGFFETWGSAISTILTIVSGFFAWFFKNLKNALKETRDVIDNTTTIIDEAVDVVVSVMDVIKIADDGTVSIPAEAFNNVKNQVDELKTASSTFSQQTSEMASAWGSLFKQPEKA